MKTVFAAFIMVMVAFSAVAGDVHDALTPDDLFLGVYAKSYHGDAGYNEDHDFKSLRLSWNVTDRLKAGVIGSDFINSVNKPTTTVGPFVEYDVIRDVMAFDNVGVGASANVQLRKGYNLSRLGVPVLPVPYVYIEGTDIDELGFIGQVFDRTRMNMSYFPRLGSDAPDQFLYMIEFNIWKGSID